MQIVLHNRCKMEIVHDSGLKICGGICRPKLLLTETVTAVTHMTLFSSSILWSVDLNIDNNIN